MEPNLEIVRHDLEVAGADSIVVLDIRRRVQIAASEVDLLATKTESITEQLEAFWTNHIGHLAREHEQRLRVLYPDGVDLAYRAAFERMTGYRDLDETFFRLVHNLRHVVPAYPTGVWI